MNCCCENCGWSEIVGSPIICNYSGNRTWRDECCEAWKPKDKTDEKDMVKIVRCKDCVHSIPSSENFVICTAPHESAYTKYKPIDWFCKGGERKDGDGDG